ncbi:MAG: hypothetical protein JWR55_18 [Aeromicrobium sp.]|jgi:hypothetical protein|nr:hypothetical protein [Aeromicrobium sp.]
MVDDFEKYADFNGGATAATIREAADSPSTHAATLQTLVADLADDSKAIRSTIEGDFQDATTMNLQPATAAARRLTQSGLYAVGLLNSLADTVETFDTTVDTLNQELHDNTYARWQAQNNRADDNSEAGSGADDDGPPELSYAEIKAEEKAKLQGRYDRAHTALETEADRVAGLFEGTPDLADVKQLVLAGYIPLSMAGVWPNLQLTDDERQQAQLNTVKNMTDEEQVEYVRNTKDIDPAIAEVITPAAQEIIANDVAKDIKDGDVDEQTVRALQLLRDQQPFAHALYTDVEPDDISNAIRELSNHAFPGGSNPPIDQADRAQLYQDFLAAAGGTLATYTKGTGEYKPTGDLAETWFQAIVDKDHPENAAALTLMIKHGGHESAFDPDFLGDLTDKVYDWEREHDGDPVWGPLNDQMGDYGIKDPSIDRGDSDDPYDDTVTYQTAYDGLANLLGGMEKTPEAAENFFDDGDTTSYHDQDVNEKLHYLLSERRWPTDDGDGLGIALEGATLNSRDGGDDDPNHLTPGEKSARLASQAVFIISHEAGRGDSAFPGDDGWQVPTGMTDSVGKMVAGYTPDVYRVAQGNGEDITGGDWIWGDGEGEDRRAGEPVGLLASNDDLAKVLQSVGRGDDKTGMQYVTTAALDYHNELNGDLMDRARMPDGSKPQSIADLRESNLDSLMDDEAARGGKSLSYIMQNGFLGGKADEAASQEERDAIAKAFGVATDLVPTPQGKIAGMLTSEGLSMLGDELGKQPDSVTDRWADDSDQAVKDSLNFQTYNQLLNHGFLGPDDPSGLPESAIKEDENGHKYIDPHLYNGDSDDVDPVAQREFNSWLSQTAYSGPGQSSINAYSSNLPNFD